MLCQEISVPQHRFERIYTLRLAGIDKDSEPIESEQLVGNGVKKKVTFYLKELVSFRPTL